MRRYLLLTAAVVVGVSVGLAAASERATLVLTTGERISGVVVFHTDARTNIRADTQVFTLLNPDGNEVEVAVHQVVAIEFVGGQPATSELDALVNDTQLLALRDGGTRHGRLIDLIGGDTVRWEDDRGREDLPIMQVARIYLNAAGARTAFNYQPVVGVVAAAPVRAPMPAQTSRVRALTTDVTVRGTDRWTDSGIQLRSGQGVLCMTTGDIRIRQNDNDVVTAAGRGVAAGAGFPLASAPVGALIGRINNGAPFLIGGEPWLLLMPASGRLMLGINDNAFDDNSGAFTVAVSR
jgi:hypothetical protein